MRGSSNAIIIRAMGIVYLILLAIVLLWLLAAAGLVYAIRHPRRKTFAVALGQGNPTDPTDLQLQADEVTFTLTDGTRSPGWIILGQNSDGPTFVIVHGFGDSRYGSLRRTPLVLAQARKIVVFDLPGQGESQAKHGYGGLREPDDVLGILEQLEPEDARRIVLLGVSMGAGVAIAAAAKAQASVRQNILGVIAESPYRHWDEPLHNMFRHRRYPRWPIIPLAGLWLSLTAEGFKQFDRVTHAAKLDCPLLVLHGSEDELCPIDSARRIADAAPQGRFIEIPGGRHNDLPFEHEPPYRAAIDDFLKSLCPDPGSGKIQGLAQAACTADPGDAP